MQRYDLLAFSLLTFSAIVLIALVIDPKGFSLKDWQTLIAALVALGGAATVYRASMAKVAFDERVHETTARRSQRGLYLRTAAEAHALREEAVFRKKRLIVPEVGTTVPNAPDLQLPRSSYFDEAWQNLDAFPRDVAVDISNIRLMTENITTLLAQSSAPIILKAGETLPRRAKALTTLFESIDERCGALFDYLKIELRKEQ